MTKNIQDAKVCVIYGGVSPEREISLESGTSVLKALQAQNIDAFGFDLKFENLQDLLKLDFDLAFISMHGAFGEDGRLQGLLDWLKKPYTGSGVLASSVAMDKAITKRIWIAQGIKTPNYAVLEKDATSHFDITKFKFPLAVKPMNLGSSFGITKVLSESELSMALDTAFKFDSKILIEEWIEGAEYTVSLVEGLNLPVIKVETSHGFYDYSAKYEANDTKFVIPAGLPEDVEKAMQQEAWRAFKAIECRGWGRVDLIRTANNENYFLEINTSPGMTSHSLVPGAAKKIGISFEELVVLLCKNALISK